MPSDPLPHVSPEITPDEVVPPALFGSVEAMPPSSAVDAPRLSGIGGFRRLLGASAWLFSANAVALGLGFLQMILAARVLGPHVYGVLALLTTFTGAVGQVLDSRVWETATSYLVRYRSQRDLVKMAAMVKLCYIIDGSTALLAFLLVAASAPWAARGLLRDPELAGLLTVFAMTLVASAPVGTSAVVLRVTGRFPALALQNVLAGVARFVAVATALMVAGTLESVVWASLVAAGLSTVLTLWMGTRAARALGLDGLPRIFKAPLTSLREDRQGIFRFLMVSNSFGTLKLVQRFGDVLLVGYVLGPAQAGFVKLARTFSDMINVPVSPVYEASYPTFAALWRSRRLRELRALASRVTTWSTLLGVVGAGILFVGAEPLIGWTAGKEYVPAAVPLRLFAIAMGMAVSTSVWHPLLVAADRQARSLVAMATGIVVQIAILLGTMAPLGTAAAGLAMIGFYLVWIVLVGSALRKVWGRD